MMFGESQISIIETGPLFNPGRCRGRAGAVLHQSGHGHAVLHSPLLRGPC